MYILYIFLAIVILLVMVMVHEFGHYVVGRMLNFKITEFSVGFGKAIFSRTNKRGELISLRIFPLGGYCAFAGEDETNPNDSSAFTNQKPWKRILVFLAGVTFNFAFAVLTSFLLLCTVGYDIPQFVNYQQFSSSNVENMIDGSAYSPIKELYPEDQLLMEGDIIISINGEKIDFAYGANYNDLINTEVEKLNQFITTIREENPTSEGKESFKEFAEQNPITAVVKRDGEYKEVYMGFTQLQVQQKDENGNLIYDENNNPVLKYSYYWDVNVKAYVHSASEALERAVPFAFGLAWVVLKSLFLLLTFQLPISSIGGPITTIATIATYTQANLSNLLVLIPLISANLAIFNILPIPALDGAHVLFTTIEAIRKKPIKRELENTIHTVGLIVLFGFVILVDILHFLL